MGIQDIYANYLYYKLDLLSFICARFSLIRASMKPVNLAFGRLHWKQTINITLPKTVVLAAKLAIGTNFLLLVYDFLALFITHLLKGH